MEEKEITIKMKGEPPLRRVLKSWKFWAFIASALLGASYETVNGNWICVIWVILATINMFLADVFKEYSSDFCDLTSRLILEQEALQDALREKDNKIAELQTEIISLRFGKTTK